MDSIKVDNCSLDSVFGGPLILRDMDESGRVISEHADLKSALTVILRARDSQGQSRVVKSLDDAARIQTIGKALQQADGFIELSSGDFKWLVSRVKEIGWQVFPTDISTIVDAMDKHEVSGSGT